MNRQYFLRLLARELYPVLRAKGFRGSGSTLRRITSPVIHVFNVQGSSSGDHCYLNLGAHLDFLPSEGGSNIKPTSMCEYHCVFRGRIEPPPGPAFGWVYGANPREADLSVEFMVSEWPTQGQPFFRTYGSYPDSFISLLASTDPVSVHARTDLHYARIATHLGNAEQAIAFARAGLTRCSERATSLRANLRNLLTELGAA